jgi:tetratricopeptide (TPR) repeat protein
MSVAKSARPRVGFVGRRGGIWTFIASWFVPVTMTIAYVLLALTSETDLIGWAWMSLGLAFVLVLWWMFRALTHTASMARAIAVGDAERVLEIDDAPLYRAVAHELRAEWTQALRALAEATPRSARDQVLAVTTKIAALVETGEVARARDVLDTELANPLAKLNPRMDAASHIAALLARGRVLTAERSHDDALALLQQVIDDIRTGSSTRALAHHYASRAAAGANDMAAAEQHRAKAAALAPGTWFAR